LLFTCKASAVTSVAASYGRWRRRGVPLGTGVEYDIPWIGNDWKTGPSQ